MDPPPQAMAQQATNEGPLQTDERELVPTVPLSLSCQFAVSIRVHSRLVSVFVSSVIFVYCELRL
jgi:hypothetical protein